MGNGQTKGDFRVALVGLEKSGKSALYTRVMKHKYLYSGEEDEEQAYSPTVGVGGEKKRVHNHAGQARTDELASFEEETKEVYKKTRFIGRQLELLDFGGATIDDRNLWGEHLASGTITGIALVVDGGDRRRLLDAKEALITALSTHGFRKNPGSAETPIAVFINKQDLSSGDNPFVLKTEEVRRALDLDRTLSTIGFTPSNVGKDGLRFGSCADSSSFSSGSPSSGGATDASSPLGLTGTMSGGFSITPSSAISPTSVFVGAEVQPSSSSSSPSSAAFDKRQIEYFECSAKTGEGIDDGLKWLCRAHKGLEKLRYAAEKAEAKARKAKLKAAKKECGDRTASVVRF